VLRNNAEAILWFRKAAEAGRAAGMVDLGAMYLLGDGVAVSEQEAAKWFEKAAAAGSGAGMYDLRLCTKQAEASRRIYKRP